MYSYFYSLQVYTFFLLSYKCIHANKKQLNCPFQQNIMLNIFLMRMRCDTVIIVGAKKAHGKCILSLLIILKNLIKSQFSVLYREISRIENKLHCGACETETMRTKISRSHTHTYINLI